MARFWFPKRLPLAVKRAGPGAAGLFAALHASAFDDAWTERSFIAFLQLHGSTGFLAWSQDAAVGFAVVRVAADEAELLTLGVDPGARRFGVGRALLDGVIATAVEGGARVLHLDVAVSNKAARRLYEASGFEEVGRRPRYYSDGDDALSCRLALQARTRVTAHANIAKQ